MNDLSCLCCGWVVGVVVVRVVLVVVEVPGQRLGLSWESPPGGRRSLTGERSGARGTWWRGGGRTRTGAIQGADCPLPLYSRIVRVRMAQKDA